MSKILKQEDGFTLVEMMIVLLVISVLLLIAVPSMTKSNDVVTNKTCEATADLVQSQVAAYKMENGDYPHSLDDLVEADYVDSVECPDGELGYDQSSGTVYLPGEK